MISRARKIIARKNHDILIQLLYYFSASKPRKILFDHLPKCGGSSLNLYLEAHYPKRKIFSTNGLNPTASIKYFKNLSQRERHEYDLVKGHLAHELINYAHPECLKITVIRDPVERIISHYFYAKRVPAHYLYSKIHSSNMSLEEYATSDLSDELRNWYTTHFSGLTADEAELNPEKSIAKAVDVLTSSYDIIGFLDNFPSFAENLRNQAGLRYEYQNRKVNVTQGRPAMNDVAQYVITKIKQVNHLDVALYRKVKDSIG